MLLTAGQVNNSSSSGSQQCCCGQPADSNAEAWTAAGSLPLTAKVADFGLAMPLPSTDTHATMLARVSGPPVGLKEAVHVHLVLSMCIYTAAHASEPLHYLLGWWVFEVLCIKCLLRCEVKTLVFMDTLEVRRHSYGCSSLCR